MLVVQRMFGYSRSMPSTAVDRDCHVQRLTSLWDWMFASRWLTPSTTNPSIPLGFLPWALRVSGPILLPNWALLDSILLRASVKEQVWLGTELEGARRYLPRHWQQIALISSSAQVKLAIRISEWWGQAKLTRDVSRVRDSRVGSLGTVVLGLRNCWKLVVEEWAFFCF